MLHKECVQLGFVMQRLFPQCYSELREFGRAHVHKGANPIFHLYPGHFQRREATLDAALKFTYS